MPPTRSRRRLSELPPEKLNVDLEACACVDGFHDFPVMLGEGCTITRKLNGKLRGLPVRQQVCRRCDTVRNQTLTWNGRVTGNTYEWSEDYINAARSLDPDMHERKRVFREVLIHQAFTEEERQSA